MSTPLSFASWNFTQGRVHEDEVLADARAASAEVGITAAEPGTGATLAFLASVLDAKSVVELGTGTGVSGLWLLRGMRADGVLTTVDIEGEHQRLAKEAFAAAGISANRVRTITGSALDVIAKLTDAAYDLVFVTTDVTEYDASLTEALRLLRPGGIVAFDRALAGGTVADQTDASPDAVTLRELLKRISTEESVRELLLPVGDGLLLAQKTSA